MYKLKTDSINGHEESDFATQEEAQAHFDQYRSQGYWGDEEQVINHPEIIINHPEIIADEGVEAAPAWIETIPAWTEIIPAQFTWEIINVNPTLEDISPRQISLALLSIGITESQIVDAINQLPSPMKEHGLIAWNRANYFVRSEPAVAMIGQLMGLSQEQLDDIWIRGKSL